MKRILILAVLAVFLLAGCKGKEPAQDQAAKQTGGIQTGQVFPTDTNPATGITAEKARQIALEHAGLTEEEVIEIHSSRDYLIYMLGFLPGFCYLGGLDERIHTPRLANPRLKINAGSVGIGGSQTGIYPLDSPGGWQLMGMTPVKTYDPDREVPILLSAGDYIRFIPVDEAEFLRIKELVERDEYQCTVREGEV